MSIRSAFVDLGDGQTLCMACIKAVMKDAAGKSVVYFRDHTVMLLSQEAGDKLQEWLEQPEWADK